MEKENKKRNLIVIVLSVIIVLLVGALVYLLFIKKEKSDNPWVECWSGGNCSNNNVQEKDNTPKDNVQDNNNGVSTNIDENFYKSKDNKVTLKLVDKSDMTAKTAIKNIWLDYYKEECKNNKEAFIEEDGISCSTLDKNIDSYLDKIYFNSEYIDSYAYYNDKIIRMSEKIEDDNYLKINGDDITGGAQCRMYYFLINKKTHVIERYNEGYYNFIKTPKGYYFTITGCATEPIPELYSSSWKKLGDILSYNYDSNSNIYASNDNHVIKYDISGNEISKSEEYKFIGNGLLINNVLYYVAEDMDNIIQLINYETKEKIKLSSHKEIMESLMKDDEDLKKMVDKGEIKGNDYIIPGWAEMELEKDIISISLYYHEDYKYTYNLKTKVLEKEK